MESDLLRNEDICMWCQENDKSSPSSHLSLPLAASIFSSTHYVPLSQSARASSPLFNFLFLAFSYPPGLTLLPFYSCFVPVCHSPRWLSFLQLSSLLPFLSLASFLLSHLLSSPLPHPLSSDFHPFCLLIFLSPPLHHQNAIYPSVTLAFWLPPPSCFLFVSSSISSPRCVVIVASLATAAIADSQAVGTRGGGRKRGDNDGGKEGMRRWRGSYKAMGLEGVVTVLLASFWSLLKSKQRWRRRGLQGGRAVAALHPMSQDLICVDALSVCCHVSQVVVFVNLMCAYTLADTCRREVVPEQPAASKCTGIGGCNKVRTCLEMLVGGIRGVRLVVVGTLDLIRWLGTAATAVHPAGYTCSWWRGGEKETEEEKEKKMREKQSPLIKKVVITVSGWSVFFTCTVKHHKDKHNIISPFIKSN